ncbi:MAG: LysE family translocator [Gemmobacter sp.]|jgi:threonine/homoserine/homoserine lactone efflux protein
MTVGLTELALYAGALVLLFITPGPVWVALGARALSGGFAAAWPLAVGVSLGDALWPLAAILGLNWIVAVWGDVLGLMRWVAVAMFLGMGWALWRKAGRALAADSRLTRPGAWAGFAAGVAAILANPKAILFYMGLLPTFFDLSRVTPADIAAIVALSMLLPMVGNLIVALSIDRVRATLTSEAARRRIDRVAGGLMIAAGIVIALG